MVDEEKNVLVEIDGLIVNFYTYQGVVQAIEGVDLVISRGETLGLVGETGCGKSVTASAIMGLIQSPPGKIEEGSVHFLEPPEVRAQRKLYESRAQEWYSKLSPVERRKMVAQFGTRRTGFKKRVRALKKSEIDKLETPEKAPRKLIKSYMTTLIKSTPKQNRVAQDALRGSYNLLAKTPKYMQKIRGKFISMIFQEPTSALNPVFPAGDQIAEVILQHKKAEMAARALTRLKKERELIKKRKRPKMILSTSRPHKSGSTNQRSMKTKDETYICSVCESEVEKDDTYCSKCGAEFYAASSWLLKPLVLQTYERILQSIVKNPDAKQSLISRIPLLRRYRTELQREALREAVKMLDIVRIPDPNGVSRRYPFELSGGMQQRVMIAIALACNPRLLIADEPTTALDVTIQGQILKLMRDLKQEYGSSILLITHNLGVVAEMSDRVGVMYAGSIAEIGPARSIFKSPLHPYTVGLMRSVPSIQMESEKLYTIRGSVPNLIYPPAGCRFHPRCDYAKEYCKRARPVLKEVMPGHKVSCHMVTKEEGYVVG